MQRRNVLSLLDSFVLSILIRFPLASLTIGGFPEWNSSVSLAPSSVFTAIPGFAAKTMELEKAAVTRRTLLTTVA
jgi:hypothetical protein